MNERQPSTAERACHPARADPGSLIGRRDAAGDQGCRTPGLGTGAGCNTWGMGRKIRFLDTAWGSVAHAETGSGPPLVFDLGWISDQEALWGHQGYRGLLTRLAESHRVVTFDPPGTGLSERGISTASIEEEEALLERVLEAAGVGPHGPVSMFCSSIAASTAIAFSAHHPHVVKRLVLFGGSLRGKDLAPPDARDSLLDLVRGHWGLGSRALSDIFVPDVSSEDRKWFHAWLRRSTDGETAARRLEMYYSSDVSAAAAEVRAPTLVLHRAGDRAVRSTQATALAAAISEATLQPLEGSAHLCFLGEWHRVADLAIPFLERSSGKSLPMGPYGEFTARETDVAELTTLGLTNAAIGERLGISPRTVESHLTHIRSKLGVRTRAEVAAWMARRTEVR